MRLEDVFQQIVDDLPWVDHERLLVGPLASRESVKDALLERVPVIPSWCAGTLSEFAAELLNKARVAVKKPLSLASQCDALERIARAPFLREALPDLCTHLRARSVAAKVARFLTHLDRFFATPEELAAICEYYESKDKSLATFVQIVAGLWAQGELSPWSDGYVLRTALSHLEEVEALPRRITLWGFHEFTPLEELFLERVAARGVEIRMLVPPAVHSLFEPRCQSMGLQVVALEENHASRHLWEPHSLWDELEFLRDELARLRASGARWQDVAIFVPNDDLYKRIVRQQLYLWNVPMRDPTLSGGWKDQPRWLWWRDLLRTMASGLRLEDVRAWLGPGEGREALFKEAFRRGVHGGARQWANLLKVHDLPELRVLIEGMPLLCRAMTPPQFAEAVRSFVPLVENVLSAETTETPLLLEFAHHLCEERPYLEGFRARLPRYLSLFEEYLDAKARTQSLRAVDGVQFVGHGVWLPAVPKHSFVLGANLIRRARPSADAWDWEGLEVRRAWEKLHFGMPWEERVLRDETFLSFGFHAAEHEAFSALDYDATGKPLAKTVLFEKLAGDVSIDKKGGHPRVGWVASVETETAEASAPRVERPDLAPEGTLRVSAFEDYLKCPFLYFTRHVLKLEPEDELGLDPDGRARGTLLHNVLGRFVQEEIDGTRYESQQKARERLDALVDDEIERTMKSGQTLSGMYRHKPLIARTAQAIKAQAARWLEWEWKNREVFPSLKPFKVEEPVEVEIAKGVQLKGRADRVDSDGKHSVVIDYKTGTAPFTGGEMTSGIGAQLLVYAQGIEQKHGLLPGAAYYLTLGSKIESRNGVFLKEHQKTLHNAHARNGGLFKEGAGTLFERVTENWTRAAEALKKGDYSPEPARKKDCDACMYGTLCGKEPVHE